jgi:hypothetical protein
MAEYFISLEEQVKLGLREGTQETTEETTVKQKRVRHSWTPMENAVIYVTWATEANKPDANPRHLAGGQVKYEMAHMVDKVRELAKGTFDTVSNDAILCQLSRCGYTLLGTNNDFTSKKYEQMFIELHKELKIWDGRLTLQSNKH